MANELKLHNTIENFLVTILALSEDTLSFFCSTENQNRLFLDLWNLGCDFYDLIRIYANAEKVNPALGEIVAEKILSDNDIQSISLNKLNSLIPRWTGTKYHSGNKKEVLQDIQNNVLIPQVGVYLYNSNRNTHNPRAYNDIYILIVTNEKNIFIDVNRRKTHEISRDLSYNKIDSIKGVHTAVSSGSWCGGQRQQCGDSGSGLR